MMKRSNGTQAGFTVLETALVLVIGGILLSMLGNTLMNTMTSAKIKTTKTRINEINTALNNYVKINGQFPCVASLEEPVNTANYGREVSTISSKTCDKAPLDGTKQVNGTDGRKVRIGMVPTRALNLPDEFGYDAWGSRYMYAVTEVMTDASTYDSAMGAISIIDSNGNPAVSPQGSVTHLVYSAGKDGKGGYNMNGIRHNCGSDGLDAENCNDDATFRNTIVTSDVKDTYFDDFLAYSAPEVKAPSPTGTMVNFQMWKGSAIEAGSTILNNKPKTFRATYKRSPGVTSALVVAVAPGAYAPNPLWLKGGFFDELKDSQQYDVHAQSIPQFTMIPGETRWAVISPDEEEEIEIGPPVAGDFRKIGMSGMMMGSNPVERDDDGPAKTSEEDSEGWTKEKFKAGNGKTYTAYYRDVAGDAKFGDKVIARGPYSIAPNQVRKSGKPLGNFSSIPQPQKRKPGKGGMAMSGPNRAEPVGNVTNNPAVYSDMIPQGGGQFSYGFGGSNGGMIMIYEYR